MIIWLFSQPCCVSPHDPLPPPSPFDSSWTEDTRSCIFSDTALHPGKDGQKPLAAELDMQIELKFEEFDELAAAGRHLLDKDHHLTQMVSGTRSDPRIRCWINVSAFTNTEFCLAGERALGGTEEYAWVDLGALEGSEAAVASQEVQTAAFTR